MLDISRWIVKKDSYPYYVNTNAIKTVTLQEKKSKFIVIIEFVDKDTIQVEGKDLKTVTDFMSQFI